MERRRTIIWLLWYGVTLSQLATAWLFYSGGSVALAAAGFIALALSAGLNLAGASELKRNGGFGTSKLVTTGAYLVLRHPQYTGWMFFNAGIALIAQNDPCALLGAAGVALLCLQSRLEERELVARFGECYLEYARRVRL